MKQSVAPANLFQVNASLSSGLDQNLHQIEDNQLDIAMMEFMTKQVTSLVDNNSPEFHTASDVQSLLKQDKHMSGEIGQHEESKRTPLSPNGFN